MSIKMLLIIAGVTFVCFLLTAWAIVNVAQKDFGSIGKKALWWVIASIPFVGFLIYLVFGYRKGAKTDS